MTAADWDHLVRLTGRAFDHGRVSLRRRRLFGCGCAALVRPFVGRPEFRAALDRAEKAADQPPARVRSLRRHERRLSELLVGLGGDGDELDRGVCALLHALCSPRPEDAWRYVAHNDRLFGPALAGRCRAAVERLVFDVGGPAGAAALPSGWRTPTAVALAGRMYESRDFAALPILADALEDAGCDDLDILAHCRDPNGVHVRGCWVIDLVLGKA